MLVNQFQEIGDQELGEVTQRVRILAGLNAKFKSLPASQENGHGLKVPTPAFSEVDGERQIPWVH